MKKAIAIYFLLAVFATDLHAQTRVFDHLGVYGATRDACNKLIQASPVERSEWFRRRQSPSVLFQQSVLIAILHDAAQEAVEHLNFMEPAETTLSLFNNLGFRRAVEGCEDAAVADALERMVAAADVRGKVMGGAGVWLMGSGLAAATRVLGFRTRRALISAALGASAYQLYDSIRDNQMLEQQIVERCGARPDGRCLADGLAAIETRLGASEASFEALILSLTDQVNNIKTALAKDPKDQRLVLELKAYERALSVALSEDNLLRGHAPQLSP